MGDEKEEKQMEAEMNQVFICSVCAKSFSDRAATKPMAITMKNAVAQVKEIVPHAKYKNDPEMATLTWKDTPGHDVKIAKQAADKCCANNVVLCSSSHVRFRKEDDGTFHIIGAEHLE